MWAAAAQSSISSFDRFQRRLRCFVADEQFSTLSSISHRRKSARLSLLCRCFPDKCSNKTLSLIPPVQTFPSEIQVRFGIGISARIFQNKISILLSNKCASYFLYNFDKPETITRMRKLLEK